MLDSRYDNEYYVVIAEGRPIAIFDSWHDSPDKKEYEKLLRQQYAGVRIELTPVVFLWKELRKMGIKFCDCDDGLFGPSSCGGIIRNNKCERCGTVNGPQN